MVTCLDWDFSRLSPLYYLGDCAADSHSKAQIQIYHKIIFQNSYQTSFGLHFECQFMPT
jgi:hypothetical protein